MNALLALSRAIDAITGFIGRSVSWLVLAAVLVSAGNAVIRKAFDMSSNAWLELQWYLFGAVFMLAAAYTLQRNEHVRIDILSQRLSKRARDWIDLFCHLFFLVPFVFGMSWLSVPFFLRSWQSGEVSASAGGLLVWPAKFLVLFGFALLSAQAVSEIVKRVAVLRGLLDEPAPQHEVPPEVEAELEVQKSTAGETLRAVIDYIAHNLAPIMFVSVMGMLLLGYPVAFTLAAGGLLFFVIGVEMAVIAPSEITLFWPLLQANPERVFGIMSNDTLLAIPFFTFMGLILERSRMAEDLLDTVGQLFGPIRGGLAYAVILVGALLAATTGVVAASVIAMGLISLPIMLRYGYDRSLATGSIAAAGTLAQIVPPSLVLIVMADQLGRSVGDMYLGAIYPALILVGLYCAYAFVMTLLRPAAAPALPLEVRTLGSGVTSLVAILLLAVGLYYAGYHLLFGGLREEPRVVWSAVLGVGVAYGLSIANRRLGLGLLSRLAEQVVIVLIPPLALIFLVLGTIFLGIATPTEGGAMGATGALILAFFKRRLDLKTVKQALDSTTKLSAFVMFILVGARVFGLTFYGVNGNIWVEELLLSLPGGETGFLIVVTVVVFILGCFLDFFEIAFIMVPLLAPAAEKLGIDLIWFGIILGLNLQMSFLTPPFGFALFYLRSIAPAGDWQDKVSGRTLAGVRTVEIYKGAIAFIFLQLLMIGIVIAFPGLVLHYKDDGPMIEPGSIDVQMPSLGGGAPGGLGLPPPELGGPAPGGAAPGGVDLSQPPPGLAPPGGVDVSQPPTIPPPEQQ